MTKLTHANEKNIQGKISHTHTYIHTLVHKEKSGTASYEINSKHFDMTVSDFSHYQNLTASHCFTRREHKVFTVNLL